MEKLREAIYRTPIIDHHAHNLLLPEAADTKELLSITSEAAGAALQHAKSSLAHLRAVKQLSEILECEDSWPVVEAVLRNKRRHESHAWTQRCLEGIHTLLLDDGLDPVGVLPYYEHSTFTPTKTFRIVRIETVAEQVMLRIAKNAGPDIEKNMLLALSEFTTEINNALQNPDVVGFKSVICYRIGLDFNMLEQKSERDNALTIGAQQLQGLHGASSYRLQDAKLNPFFLLYAAKLISKHPKPIQFHTGLGDNDLDIRKASPAHLRPFIERFPTIPVVLLHGGYPFTREGAYLASVYPNCYLDVGEVFPMISQAGQEGVISQALELCPTEKLMWSTDGHWFPETYLLAVIQVREALDKVLSECVERSALTGEQAVRVVQDLLFHTANKLYGLNFHFQVLPIPSTIRRSVFDFPANDEPQFLRVEWLDYSSTLRSRTFTLKEARKRLKAKKFMGLAKPAIGILQDDHIPPGFKPVGEYSIEPIPESLRRCQYEGLDYAVVRAEFREPDGSESNICPRTVLRRAVDAAASQGVSFLVGYEIEVVFLEEQSVDGKHSFSGGGLSQGHAWCTARAMHSPRIAKMIASIVADLERANIELQHFHPESAPGQYEFVTAPLTPIEAADALLVTREIIQAAASRHSLRATLVPKPFPMAAGTGAHIHISLQGAVYEPFYAGILQHLKAICAFTYPNAESYKRVADHCWAGGRYIAWGSQNRETPLRKVEGSHWELKCVDGLAHVYLALAVIIRAGLLGLQQGYSLDHEDCQDDPGTLDEAARNKLGIFEMLPQSIGEALEALNNDWQLGQALGEDVIATYMTVKTEESAILARMEEEERRNWLIERY